jgi:hypothetical protein
MGTDSERTFAFLFRGGVGRGVFWHRHWSHIIVALVIFLRGRRWIHVCISCDISLGAISSAFA